MKKTVTLGDFHKEIYSWYKGNIFPDDMDLETLRKDHKICLFNNSTHVEGVNTEEIKKLW